MNDRTCGINRNLIQPRLSLITLTIISFAYFLLHACCKFIYLIEKAGSDFIKLRKEQTSTAQETRNIMCSSCHLSIDTEELIWKLDFGIEKPRSCSRRDINRMASASERQTTSS
uniref:Uncharacterized protein n=1 Tax=Glossina pallidipes TaxID=7398 RepID=A0A1A9ZUC9_GLOPL